MRERERERERETQFSENDAKAVFSQTFELETSNTSFTIQSYVH